MAMKPSIAIITVVYNNYQVLKDFLASLKKQQTDNFHLFIADASSTKQQIDTDDIPITVIHTENKGYAHGVNIGLKSAAAKGYTNYCVINDDVFFNENFTGLLNQTFQEHPQTIFGGKIYYAPGYEYHKTHYREDQKGKVIWYAGGEVDWDHAVTRHIGVDAVDNETYVKPLETGFITGCFMCFDQQVLDKVGLWDKKYFLYYEDADYCERAKKMHIKLLYEPAIHIWHKNAQSTDGSGSSLHQKFQKHAQLRFALKYAPLRTKLHIINNYLFS